MRQGGRGWGMGSRRGFASGRGIGGGMGVGLGFRGGYLQPTDEAKKLWDRLAMLEMERYRLQWDLFELKAAENVDQKAVQAKTDQLRDLAVERARIARELQGYWKAAPGYGRGAQGQCPLGGQDRGQGRGWGTCCCGACQCQ